MNEPPNSDVQTRTSLMPVCISVIQFCENNVKNLRDSCSKNCKLLFFNNLHDTLNAPKYL